MKNSSNYLALWQQKRNELKVDADPQADWLQMQELLDEHLPVTNKPGGFKGFKTLPMLFVTFSAAAMIYTISSVYKLEKNSHSRKHKYEHRESKGITAVDSLSVDSLSTDSSSTGRSPGTTDSSLSAKTQAGGKNSSGGSISPANSKPNQSSTINSAAKNGVTYAALSQSGRNGAIKNSGSTANSKNNPQNPNARNSNPGVFNHHVTGAPGNGSVAKNRAPGVNSRLGHSTGAGNGPAGRHSGHSVSGTSGNSHPGGNQVSDVADHQNSPNINSSFRSQTDSLLAVTTPPFLSVLHRQVLNTYMPRVLTMTILPGNSSIPQKASTRGKAAKDKKVAAIKSASASNVDWGILIAANSSGSFTPKSQNANFYGSGPVDVYFGLFATIKINDNWAVDPQFRLFSPQTISTTYSHANKSRVDSGQMLSITSSWKSYSVSIPIYAVYKLSNGFSFKAGPVITLPIKQINANSVLSPYNIRTDTSYYKGIDSVLRATQYQQKLNFGFSVGAAFQYKRWIFEATYLKNLGGYKVSSGFGAYPANPGTIQIGIGFQLDKVKP